MKKIKLSIPEPCQQNWDDMMPTQQGRFCSACANEVIDFSQMSDTDVLNYFEIVKHGKVCGRAYPDQLNRPITNLPEKRLFWYWNYLVALFLFFSKSTTTKAQGEVKLVQTPVLKPINQANINDVLQQARDKERLSFSGLIQAEDGTAVPFATVRLLRSNTGVVTDEDGTFALMIDSLPCIIEISSLGYQTKQLSLNDIREKQIVLSSTDELLSGVVVTSTRNSPLHAGLGGVAGGIMIERKNIVKDTLKNWIGKISPTIKIYPNPISKGNQFTVGLTLKHPGNYNIQIINTAGSILLQRQISATVKKHTEKFLINAAWSGGIYYLRLIDDKGKNIATGNIVVQ